MPPPTTLDRSISPPPTRRTSSVQQTTNKDGQATFHPAGPSLAAIEAGQAKIKDHLAYFASHLSNAIRPGVQPHLPIQDFQDLYQRNDHRHGKHFVIHQHDHPISGVHYDLRLQFSESSTISFAIPYGLPGNPNSLRPNRMAIETRVHNLWNNLLESASHATGSLLIWDTGEYEILPWKQHTAQTTDDELSDPDFARKGDSRSQSDRLFAAFQERHIRLRLNGSRLPPGYTVLFRLPYANDRSRQPNQPRRKRRRIDPAQAAQRDSLIETDSDASQGDLGSSTATDDVENAAAFASEDDEDTTTRANNAYTGANNTIGSIHQRNWFLSLDKRNSGFRRARSGLDEGRWIDSWQPFFVRGRDHERSLVTGRSADEVMEDEGVAKFVGRKMWRPIME